MSKLRKLFGLSKKDLAVVLSGAITSTGAITVADGQFNIEKGEESKTQIKFEGERAISPEQSEKAFASEILQGKKEKKLGYEIAAIGGGLLGLSALKRKKNMNECGTHGRGPDTTRQR